MVLSVKSHMDALIYHHYVHVAVNCVEQYFPDVQIVDWGHVGCGGKTWGLYLHNNHLDFYVAVVFQDGYPAYVWLFTPSIPAYSVRGVRGTWTWRPRTMTERLVQLLEETGFRRAGRN
jgi:hypothetical protein